MNVCPLCGAKVSEDDIFCESCGHNLLQEREEKAKGEVEAAAPAEPVAPAGVEQAAPTVPEEMPAPVAPPTTARLEEVPAPEEAAPAVTAAEGGFAVPTLPPAEGDGAPARDNTWTWIIVIAIVLLVLLCCCCTATFLFFYLLPAS